MSSISPKIDDINQNSHQKTMQNNYATKKVHIKSLQAGSTIIHHGKMMTVCNANLRYCSIMGLSVFGDTYNLGTKPVELVTFARAYCNA